MPRWTSANLLQTGVGGRRLWNFAAEGDRFTLKDDATLSLSEPMPSSAVYKDWHTLFRGKLNVAWLPADKVFLRVIHLPSSDPNEVASMVELQLEKLSPLPVTQIVWSLHLLPKVSDKPETLQSVVVIIASRIFVEEFLGVLEGHGYMSDRLEAPGLDQLLALKVNDDGVWIWAGAPDEPVLIAWWYAGILQNLTLLPLPPGPERVAQLKTQIEQIAWAGELDGWLTAPPKIHLIAAPAEAAFWEPALQQWAGESIHVSPPPAPSDLAAVGAQRAGTDGATTNLLPPEFATRYHQQFVDNLWMRGLFAVLAVYMLGVLIYFAALFVLKMKYDKVQAELNSITATFNNAKRDAEQIRILKDRQQLKYAALDCWRAVAQVIPDSVTLEDLSFSHGKLELRGTAQSEKIEDVSTFNEALRNVVDPVHGELLFEDVGPPTVNARPPTADWRFACTVKGGGDESQ